MGDASVVDAMTGALHDPFGHGHMGVTAENIAAKYGFTREQQDAYSVESHRRAAQALEKGLFKSQVVPIEAEDAQGRREVRTDEHVRKDVKPGGHGEAQSGVQEGRHRDGRQRFRHQRRRARRS
jgi:acetyl-CoA C-acetyltransferase